jgi:hypothetical protein
MTAEDEESTKSGGLEATGPSFPTASMARVSTETLSAVLANGLACQNWLSPDQLNLERARASISLVIRDVTALSKIMARIRWIPEG